MKRRQHDEFIIDENALNALNCAICLVLPRGQISQVFARLRPHLPPAPYKRAAPVQGPPHNPRTPHTTTTPATFTYTHHAPEPTAHYPMLRSASRVTSSAQNALTDGARATVAIRPCDARSAATR
jgi:hypothetical protein